MRLISINIGEEQPLAHAKASGKTGIFKQPAQVPVMIITLGIQGDTICDTENHGGPDQALYVYGVPDYEWWARELGRPLAPGTFGENLTVAGLESADLCVGDRFHIGQVILEVTAPRIPCITLARRMDDPSFPKRFLAAERPGVYCRVLCQGSVQAGDVVRHEPYTGERVTARALVRSYITPPGLAELQRQLEAPLAVRARLAKEGQLARLKGVSR
jgi:MOSC domain-containing protein YiiM